VLYCCALFKCLSESKNSNTRVAFYSSSHNRYTVTQGPTGGLRVVGVANDVFNGMENVLSCCRAMMRPCAS
jgi:hypothetical protein